MNASWDLSRQEQLQLDSLFGVLSAEDEQELQQLNAITGEDYSDFDLVAGMVLMAHTPIESPPEGLLDVINRSAKKIVPDPE